MLSFIRQLGKLVGVARQHTEALDKAKESYENHGSLPEILDSYVGHTSYAGDDVLRSTAINGLSEFRNSLHNISGTLYGVQQSIDRLADLLYELETEPLRKVVGDEEEDKPAPTVVLAAGAEVSL